MKRLAVLISLVALFSLAFAAPVLAAPSNDTYAGRAVTGAHPFSDTVDTTEATTDADDVEANASCLAPATDASVWYELTATTDGTIIVDVSASDYSAGVIVAVGSPGNFSLINCGPATVGFFALSGQTFAILAFDFQGDGGGNGGTLNITIDEPPPPPEVDVTVDPVGTFNADGSATISGTVTCTGEADFRLIDVQLTQKVGRFAITGSGFVEFAFVCDGTTQPWSVEVIGTNGMFKGGRTVSVTTAIACGHFGCGEEVETTTVSLRR